MIFQQSNGLIYKSGIQKQEQKHESASFQNENDSETLGASTLNFISVLNLRLTILAILSNQFSGRVLVRKYESDFLSSITVNPSVRQSGAGIQFSLEKFQFQLSDFYLRPLDLQIIYMIYTAYIDINVVDWQKYRLDAYKALHMHP